MPIGEEKASGAHFYEKWGVTIEAFGFSVGIWVLWKETILVDVLFTHPQFVAVKVTENNSSSRNLSLVYGSPCHSLWKDLYYEITRCELNSHDGWLSIGDYNSVVSSNEISNRNNFSSIRCPGFNEWIVWEGHIDIGFSGLKYTLARGVNSTSFKGARLDRAICSVEWRLWFPDAEVIHLPRVSSDHTPLLVRLSPPSVSTRVIEEIQV
ncbi:PREDICTED: uncharacterized protein LOC109173323 [Ipomoea nil]|uniref:uncharacterized protein LOC109173323 n=1 Tax=Ipomoea nil TaxID=35883 RepID=UPI000901922E|nr:PREDICTED: uncharacterized protein LOC109173323 [Ipomoea nil]